MSNHVKEWLNAYLDGELKNGKLRQVEKHLAECEECRAELESLQNLSNLLHDSPMPEFTSPERFAARVGLRLPHGQPRVAKRRAQDFGWWMVPVSLLLLAVLLGTTNFVGNIISTAGKFGLLDLNNVPTWAMSGLFWQGLWTGRLGEFGLLSGAGLQWAEYLERFTRNHLLQGVLQGSLALLYLGWMAIWWARYAPRKTDQLSES
jgi:hypothetical protein